MATYRATEPAYLSAEGRYIVPGEEFTTSIKPGRTWEPLDDDAKKAVAALDDEPAPKPTKAAAAKPKADDQA